MKSTKAKGISYRPKIEHAARLNELIEATERDKAFFLDKALDAFLPELEKRYEKELGELRKKKRTNYTITPHAHSLNDDAEPGELSKRASDELERKAEKLESLRPRPSGKKGSGLL